MNILCYDFLQNARVEIEAIAVLGDVEEKKHSSSAGWSTLITSTSIISNILFVVFVHSVV